MNLSAFVERRLDPRIKLGPSAAWPLPKIVAIKLHHILDNPRIATSDIHPYHNASFGQDRLDGIPPMNRHRRVDEWIWDRMLEFDRPVAQRSGYTILVAVRSAVVGWIYALSHVCCSLTGNPKKHCHQLHLAAIQMQRRQAVGRCL